MTARLTDEQKAQRAEARKIERAAARIASNSGADKGPTAVTVDGVTVAETRKIDAAKIEGDTLTVVTSKPKKAAAKPAAKKAASKPVRRPVVVSEGKLSTDAETLPTDLDALKTLLKISRDRRWRAGRREDAALVADMSKRIEKIEKAIKAATPKKAEKAAPVKAVKAAPKKAASKPAAKPRKATASK